jgi:hypothetical protein
VVGSGWLVGKNLKGEFCDLLQDTVLHLLQNSKDILSIPGNKLRFKPLLTVVSKDGNFVL